MPSEPIDFAPARQPEPPPASRPFPLDALPAEAARLCGEAARAFDCDPGYAAPACLSVLSAAAAAAFRVVIKAGTWRQPAVVWTANVAPTGSVKTGVFDVATAPAEALQSKWFTDYRHAVAEYEAAYPPDRKGNRTCADDPDADVPPAPELAHLYVKDATTEKLLAILAAMEELAVRGAGDGDPDGPSAGRCPSLLWLRMELAGLFGNAGRYGGGRAEADTATLLELWDGAGAKIDRKSGPTLFIKRAMVAVAGTIQPETLARVAVPEGNGAGIDNVANGLIGRFLVSRPRPPSGRWRDDDVSDATAGAWDGLVRALYRVPGAGTVLEPEPRDVRLSADAKRLFVPFVNDNAEAVAAATDPITRASLAKLRGYAARLALVRHAADVAAGRCRDADRLDAAAMDAGIELAGWFANEAGRCFAPRDPEAEERDRRLAMIRGMGGRVSVRDWQRRRSLAKSADARRELSDLADAGHVRAEVGPVPAGGGPQTEAFALVGHGDDDRDGHDGGGPDRPTPDKRPDPDAPRGRSSEVRADDAPPRDRNGHPTPAASKRKGVLE